MKIKLERVMSIDLGEALDFIVCNKHNYII